MKLLWREKKYLWQLSRKFLKDKYVGSVLGISWAFITPLLLAGVITFVFTRVARVTLPNYTLMVLSGLLPWMYFSASLSEGSYSLLGYASLLKRFTFSPVIVPLSVSGANFLNLLLSMGVMLPVFIFFKRSVLLSLPLLFLFLFLFFLLTSGIMLIISWSNVFLRDIGHLTSLGLLFWFWITPVFYTFSLVPGRLTSYLYLNPLTPFMRIFHSLLYEGSLPKLFDICLAFLYALFFWFTGYTSFCKKTPETIKRI